MPDSLLKNFVPRLFLWLNLSAFVLFSLIMFLWPLKKRKLLSDSKLLGKWGEKHSEKLLRKKGLKNLTRNFTCKTGEIDLVMVANDGTIIFVEVKTRADESFGPVEDVITSVKKTRLYRAARHFLTVNNIEDRPLRFDVVAVLLGETGPVTRHYENAFTP